jgi:hypothetical protein
MTDCACHLAPFVGVAIRWRLSSTAIALADISGASLLIFLDDRPQGLRALGRLRRGFARLRIFTAELLTAGPGAGEAFLRADGNHPPLFLGEGGVDVQHEGVSVGAQHAESLEPQATFLVVSSPRKGQIS